MHLYLYLLSTYSKLAELFLYKLFPDVIRKMLTPMMKILFPLFRYLLSCQNLLVFELLHVFNNNS